MSRRPNIKSKHEKKIEAGIQAARQARTRADTALGKASRAKAHAGVEPYITCVGRGPVKGEIPKDVRRWIRQETREQLARYKDICKAMDELAPLREQWVKAFFERITGPRGFSVHAGQRRTLDKSELHVRPNRPWRVVW